MADADTENQPIKTPGLPMVLEPPRPRPSLVRNPTTATFVSHLLVAHTQTEETAPRVGGALGAYSEGAKISARRMPQGFRRTVIA